MTDSKMRSGKKGVKTKSSRQSSGGGARKAPLVFPQPGFARVTLRDGGDRTGEKETSRKKRSGADGGAEVWEDGWMEGGGSRRIIRGRTREERWRWR